MVDEQRQYTKLTKWRNEPKISNLKADFDEADNSRQLQINKILEYRQNMEGGKPLPKSLLRKGKSTQRPLVIRKQAEWAYPIMEEPFLNTENMFMVRPRGKNDETKAKIASILLNWFMNTKINKTQFIGEMTRTLYDEGTVIVKDGWYIESDTIEVESMEPVYGSPEQSLQVLQQKVQNGEISPEEAQAMMEMGEPVQIGEQKVTRLEERLVENHPTLEVLDNTNVVVDPTCEGDISKAQFIIHEYDTNYASLKEQEYDSKTGTGIYKNLNKVVINNESKTSTDYEIKDTTFYFKDKPRQRVTAYEYWGYWDIDGSGTLTGIVATWIGEVMVRLEKNPFPHGELPFSVVRYMPRKKEFWGQPDGELLKENQETIGVYRRAMHDQTITNALGQTLTEETLFSTPSQWQAFDKGHNARYREGADPDRMIWRSQIQPIDRSTFDMINFERADAESIIGKKAFNDGISGNSLGDNVGGIKSATDATTKRSLSVLRRISDELLRNIARHMLANAQEFMEEETVIRVTDGEWVEVLKQEIQMEYDLKVEINTPEKEQDVSNKISFMLQTTMQSMPFDMSKILMIRWARVNKMPEVEKDFEEIQPPAPSPEEQQMQQMQMEKMRLDLETAQMNNEKIRAEIAKIYADRDRTEMHTYEANSRMADEDPKAEKALAEADLKKAMAAKVRAETDTLDAKFLAYSDGDVRNREIEDMEYKAQIQQHMEDKKIKADMFKQQMMQQKQNRR